MDELRDPDRDEIELREPEREREEIELRELESSREEMKLERDDERLPILLRLPRLDGLDIEEPLRDDER